MVIASCIRLGTYVIIIMEEVFKVSSTRFFSDIRQFAYKDLDELSVGTSSKGNQQKWYCSTERLFVKGPFIWQGVTWKDWKVELLACDLAKQCKVENLILQQMYGEIEGLPVVYSEDFRDKLGTFVSFGRLLKLNELEYPQNAFPEAKFDFIVNTVEQICGIDITDYILTMALLDALVGNEDRHLNNFGVYLKDGEYNPGPLFDFGLGLFEHDLKYQNKDLETALEMMECKPFNSNPVSNVNWLKGKHGHFLKRLPGTFRVAASDFPNELSKQYFSEVCKQLEVEVCIV